MANGRNRLQITTVTAKAITDMADHWSVLEKLNSQYEHERPEGSFTVNEYCDRFRVSRHRGRHVLESMEFNGKITSTVMKLLDDGGTIRKTRVYVIVGKAL